MLLRLYRAIDRDKIQFDFLVHREKVGSLEDEVRQLGGKIHRVPPVTIRGLPRYVYALWKFFGAHPEYRVVHAHTSYLSAIALGVALLRGVPARLVHSHQAGLKTSRRTVVAAVGRALLRVVATHRLACGNLAGKWMFGTREFYVVPNALDLESVAYRLRDRIRIRAELGLDDAAVVVGHVGNFSAVKNHSRLLKIFAELAQQEPRARLLLVGDGHLRDQIEQHIRLLGLKDKVSLTGVRQDVPSLLSAMDVLLFPSLSEGLPVTVVEAQAAGLPCVVSESVTSEVGLTDLVRFVSLDEPDDLWATELLTASSQTDRRSRTKELRDAGYESAQVASAMDDLYFALVEQSRRDGGRR